MNLNQYIESIHRQLAVTAEAGGDEARALAERLAAPLDAALRLALQDALAAAAEEITVEMAPGSVELRLRGREPEFVVTPPPAAVPDLRQGGPDVDDGGGVQPGGFAPAPAAGAADDGAVWRINLRLPLHMKPRVEQAASRGALSVNSWLQRAVAAALEPSDPSRRERHTWTGGERFSGWVR